MRSQRALGDTLWGPRGTDTTIESYLGNILGITPIQVLSPQEAPCSESDNPHWSEATSRNINKYYDRQLPT